LAIFVDMEWEIIFYIFVTLGQLCTKVQGSILGLAGKPIDLLACLMFSHLN